MPGETTREGLGLVHGAPKVAARILPIHEIQLANYLKASTITVGMILNFGPQPSFRRMVLSFPRGGSAMIRC